MRKIEVLLGLAVFMAACTSTPPPPEPTALQPLQVDVSTSTETPTATPTETPAELPTETPTDQPTLMPTELPTEMPPAIPTSTPYPNEGFLNDQWVNINPPSQLTAPLDRNWLAFANFDTPRSATPEGGRNLSQKLFLVRPDNRQRLEVAEIPASAGSRVFWSPRGTQVAYFVDSYLDENGAELGGLYMLDFPAGVNYRLFGMKNLNPRGISGHVPVWASDGSLLAMVLPTDYATDIFALNADGTNFRNLTNSASYDLYPAFSPDGQWLAFVSDRNQCPSWLPDTPQSCDRPDASPPNQGNLFLLNLFTGDLRQVTDVLLNGSPQWVTPTKLAFSTGGGNALAESSDLWLVDIEAGSAVQISPAGTLNFSESWSNDATRVIYQRAGDATEIILADNVGRIVANSSEYIFPRFGLAADWSPNGQYIAIGGRNGRCPYGLWVVSPTFEVVTAPARLLACDPTYAPAGNYLAFIGIQPSTSTDGRVDIYVANPNGLGASNLTSTLRGQMYLLGWVGG